MSQKQMYDDYHRDWHSPREPRLTCTALSKIVYCLGCARPTMGSIGAAGYFWRSLCQECKDKADAGLKAEIKRVFENY